MGNAVELSGETVEAVAGPRGIGDPGQASGVDENLLALQREVELDVEVFLRVRGRHELGNRVDEQGVHVHKFVKVAQDVARRLA